MLFPELQNQRSILIDLNLEAERWLATRSAPIPNPLLDPKTCQQFVDDCHRRLGVDYSYGGWMEDRSTLWRGSYLDADQRYIHLGVDFNVPAGTKIAVERSCTVVRIDSDYPDKYGWGTRVIVHEPDAKFVMLFAHLDQKLEVKIGETLQPGSILAKVGKPPYNGDWFPHLHVQIVDLDHYHELLKNDLRDLDGYGHARDLELLKRIFPNPVTFLHI
jgi:murein DD-endopeptidase MepM/ murein hydrolase activator NlpD